MSLRLRRGLDADRLTITPESGEPLWTTDTKLLYIGDGTTAGGNPVGGGTGDVVGPASSVNNRVVFFDGTTGKLIKDSGLTLSGTNTGDQTITLTGDVTGSGTGSFAATIANSAVTLAKMANLVTGRIIGNNSGSTGAPLSLTGTQVTAMLDVFTTSLQGLAPASGGGTSNFLRADGTWAAPSGGSGTVTSITFSSPLTGGTITTSGTVTIPAATSLVNGYLTSADWTTFNSKLSGNQTITLSGDVSGSGATSITATIGSGVVTLAKMASLAANSIIGNNTGGATTPLALTGTQVTAMLDLFSTSATTKGLVPGSNSLGSTYFLRADGTWAVPSGGGGSSAISALTVAAATNTIDNTNYKQEWQWSTLAGDDGLKLSSTSTAAASNAQTLFHLDLSGANASSAQTTYTAQFSNVHTGTTSTNIGIRIDVSGGSENSALWINPTSGSPTISTQAAIQVHKDANSVTQSDRNGIFLSNATAATVGLQSISPPIVLQGNGWKTNSTAGSQDVRFRIDVLPVQGAAAPTATFQIAPSINGAAYAATPPFRFTSAGILQISSGIESSGYLSASGYISSNGSSSTGNFYVGSSSSTTSSALAGIQIGGSSSVNFRTTMLGSSATLGVGNAYANLLIGDAGVTEAASGTHPIITALGLKGLTITNGAGATTNAATLYIGAAPTGITPSGGLYSILVDSGNVKFGGDMYCNGFLTNNNTVPGSSYAELKAGTTSLSPLIIGSGAPKTTAAQGAIDYQYNFYATNNARQRAGIGGSINESYTTVGNPLSTTETTLHTFTLVASSLYSDGDKLELIYAGDFTGHTLATNTIKVYFAGTAIFSTGAASYTDSATTGYEISCKIIKSGASSIRYSCTIKADPTLLLSSTNRWCQTGELTGVTLSSAQIVKITSQAGGTGYAADDVKMYFNQISFSPLSIP